MDRKIRQSCVTFGIFWAIIFSASGLPVQYNLIPSTVAARDPILPVQYNIVPSAIVPVLAGVTGAAVRSEALFRSYGYEVIDQAM